ncbi:MAG: hypothetical protein K2G33_00965 [Duncaniella sp.]|nr:hypothetical protein [Duncaniella sp.]
MIKKLIITFLVMLMSVGAYADDNPKDKDGNKEPKYLPLVLDKIGLPTTRPRSPAKAADIECYYYDGYICIAFNEPEGNASLLLEDMVTSESATYTFSTSAPFAVYVGEPSGILRLQLTTEDGNTYVGYLDKLI